MRHALVVAGFCLTLLVPSVSLAGVPSPVNSTVPALVGCPTGDLSFTVIVRDAAFLSVPNSVVTLSFGACSTFTHCSGSFPGYIWNPVARTASAVTDSAGGATFAIHQGGVCPSVSVTADGVPLASRAFASTDQNGDLQVTADDDSIAAGKLFTTDGTADFDGNGIVDTLDVRVVNDHRGHNCGGAPGQGANAGPDRTVECAGPSGTPVQLDGTASQGTSLSFHWSGPGITFDDPHSATPTGIFPLGTTAVLLEVQSDQGPSQDEVLVTVRDTHVPILQDFSLSPIVLWPPDRRLVPIHATVIANDTCDGDSATVSLFSITVSGADSTSLGDDVQGASFGTADFDFLLRAKRDHGQTRVYTVCYEARDASGNVMFACGEVVVARDSSGRAQLLSSPDGWTLTLYGSQDQAAATTTSSSPIVRAGNDDLLLASGDGPSLVDMDGDSFLDAVFSMEPTGAGSGSIEGQPLWARWSASSLFYLAEIQMTPLGIEPDQPIAFGARVSPNPAIARATIVYSIPGQGHVRLRVFDVSGRTVATLVDGVMPGGRRSVTFDGGRKTGASLYFYTLEANGRRASGKFVLVK